MKNSIKDGLLNLKVKIEEGRLYATLKGISTGYLNLDNETGGLRQGSFIVVGARPGMGKTIFSINLMLQIAKQKDVPVHFFSLENDENYFLDRLVGIDSGIPVSLVEKRKLTSKQKERCHNSINKLKDLSICFNQCKPNVKELENLIEDAISLNDVKVIFIDNLHQVIASAENRKKDVVNNTASMLKAVAIKHKVCIVATSEVSRDVEYRGGDNRPILSDLRVSGSIEQEADLVTFLYRPDYYGFVENPDGSQCANQGELIIAKNRYGKLSTCWFNFNYDSLGFEEMDKPQFWD